MSLPVLKIAVVGHTNTGKTSLMRTLARDPEFGEVSDRPATTRHVEGVSISVQGQPLFELYDTPGLEDSIALLEHLDQLFGGRRTGGVDIIKQFLDSPPALGRFEQESKAIRQVLASDVALYVIDARVPVSGKHRDELEIFSRCAKPIVPVLNFVASLEAQKPLWRDQLSRVNLHAVAEFDTMVLDEHSEQRLLEKMQTLLDDHRTTLDAMIDDRKQQRQQLIHASAAIVSDMLIDVAGHSATVAARTVPPTDATPEVIKEYERNREQQMTAAMEAFRARVRSREQTCVDKLIELHRFRASDYDASEIPLVEGKWGTDLFSPIAWKELGEQTTGGAIIGAILGLAVDAMTLGTSFGAFAAIGAALGAAVQVGSTGLRLMEKSAGGSELRCDDAMLWLLMVRQVSLVGAMLRRGHASNSPMKMSSPAACSPSEKSKKLPSGLEEAKKRPEWSRLNEKPSLSFDGSNGAGRDSAMAGLTASIESMIR